jgi:hypothetical protein
MPKRIPLREEPARRPAQEILDEIRQIYFKTSAATIDGDFDRAVDLLKSMEAIEDRQRATVYMEGLAEMRNEWRRKRRPGKPPRRPG